MNLMSIIAVTAGAALLSTGTSPVEPVHRIGTIESDFALGRGVEARSSDTFEERCIVTAAQAASSLNASKLGRVHRGCAKAVKSKPAYLALAKIMANGLFAIGDYRAAAASSDEWLTLSTTDTPERSEMLQLNAIATALSDMPRMHVSGRSQMSVHSVTVDKAGLKTVQATMGSNRITAVLDSGANLSVLSESTAARIGVRTFQGGSIGSSTRKEVPARLALAARVVIDEVELRNVVFLVLPDAALHLPVGDGHQIDAILGFPIFKALTPTCRTAGSIAFRAAPAHIDGATARASTNDIYVDTTVDGIRVPMFLDTGATNTRLTSRLVTEAGIDTSGLPIISSGTAGAGGVSVRKAATRANSIVAIGSTRVTLPILRIELPTDKAPQASHLGVIGNDLLKDHAYTLDLRTMRFSLGGACGQDELGQGRKTMTGR